MIKQDGMVEVGEVEKALYEMKWFDYRGLYPDHATLLFVYIYIRIIGKYFEHLGERGGRFFVRKGIMKQLDANDPRSWKHWKSMEKLRQWADKRCLRYDMFWKWMTQTHADFGLGTKKLTDKTTKKEKSYRGIYISIFMSKTLLANVDKLAIQHEQNFVTRSESDFFNPRNYEGHPSQNEYFEYLVFRVKRRNPSTYRQKVVEMVDSGLLPESFRAPFLQNT